jgi:hypothetical protein
MTIWIPIFIFFTFSLMAYMLWSLVFGFKPEKSSYKYELTINFVNGKSINVYHSYTQKLKYWDVLAPFLRWYYHKPQQKHYVLIYNNDSEQIITRQYITDFLMTRTLE